MPETASKATLPAVNPPKGPRSELPPGGVIGPLAPIAPPPLPQPPPPPPRIPAARSTAAVRAVEEKKPPEFSPTLFAFWLGQVTLVASIATAVVVFAAARATGRDWLMASFCACLGALLMTLLARVAHLLVEPSLPPPPPVRLDTKRTSQALNKVK